MRLPNSRVKQLAQPVAPLSVGSADPGTGPAKARVAPGHAEA